MASVGTLAKTAAKRKAQQAVVATVSANPGTVVAIVAAVVILLLLLLVAAGAAVFMSMSTTSTVPETKAAAAQAMGLSATAGVPATWRQPIIDGGKVCPAVLSAPLLAAQLKQESGWNARAVSPVGAAGPGQFMPGTWAAYGLDGNHDGVKDIYDPADAIPAAAAYDCALAKTVASIPGDRSSLMLAAYNAGPYAVIAAAGVPPYPETQQYVAVIKASAATMGDALTGGGFGGSGGPTGNAIVAAARTQTGQPYVWGGGGYPQGSSSIGRDGRGPGFDCSGLTQWAVGTATGGRTVLPRLAQDQASTGSPVAAGPTTLSAMQPGDLIGFADSPGGYIHHIGIYVGGGQMINAPSTGSNVRLDNLTSSYYRGQSWTVRRLG